MFIITIIVFIFIIGILIFVHEFFHFLAAKKLGVKVEEFCLGFPPRIFKTKRGETVYSIGLFPIGGFVKLFGEEKEEKAPDSFYNKSVGTRAKITSAGFFANFILAIILFSFCFYFGFPEAIEEKVPSKAKEIAVQIIAIAPNSPAMKADLAIGDKILKVRNFKNPKVYKEIKETQDLLNFSKANAGEEIILTIKRGKEILEKKLIPRKDYPSSVGRVEGPIGVALIKTAIISYPFPENILKSFESTFFLTGATLFFFGKTIKNIIIGEKIEGVEIIGPIGIGGLVSQMINLGLIHLLYFIAILSLNLAIINALPFPALDGGRLLFLLIEKIKKAPIKIEIENLINQIGFIILIILMIIITIRDIGKLF